LSVDFLGIKKKEFKEKGEEDFYFPLASSFEYKEYWIYGVEKNNLELIKNCNIFDGEKFDQAIDELNILLRWCDENITDGYEKIMHYKITEILSELSKEKKDSFDRFSVG